MISLLFLFFQDNVIFERLTKASHYKDLTVAHLEQFATEGGKQSNVSSVNISSVVSASEH